MREFKIVHQALQQCCPELHAKRLNTLMAACEALFHSDTLTLTAMGRHMDNGVKTKHCIKRMDRLLGNHHLHQERMVIYRWHAALLCQGNTLPTVLVDWADIREQQRLMVLRASVALSGRSVTLYERTFTLENHNTAQAHQQFLNELASLLPAGVKLLILSDAGFKNPWFRAVEKQGWYWLSRVRGRVTYADRIAENWKPVSTLHKSANSRAKFVGSCRLARANPISCELYLYRGKLKGRKNQRSTTTNSHHPDAAIYSRAAKEPWVLATNLPANMWAPIQLVRLYQKRMQIEETFRDLKSPAYGLGLRHSRTTSPKRFDIMLLIALLLQLLLWWVGLFAQHIRWHTDFQANTERSRNVLSMVRLGKEVLRRKDYRLTKRDLLKGVALFIKKIRQNGDAAV